MEINALGDLTRIEHIVDAARGHGVLRHLVNDGGAVLGVSDSAMLLDGHKTFRSITVIPREHHRNGPFLAIDSQRVEETIKRFVMRGSL